MTLNEIESLTKKYSDARGELSEAVSTLNDLIEAAKRQALPKIKRLVARAAEHHAQLQAAIESSADEFKKPRTHIFHGVKVGFQKGKGTLEIPDAEDTLARVKKMFGHEFEAYVATKETLKKDALAGLPAADLKKLGCIVTDTGDVVVIKPTDSAVDKIVSALLKDAVEEAKEAA